MTKFRFGIIGTANIARGFVNGVRGSSLIEVTAIASRSQQAASDFAAEFGIAQAFGSYQQLLDEAQIDAVYIPLPNSMHAEWAIKALERGIPVLCEKPLGLSRAQATVMFDAAARNDTALLEAFPYLYQPQTGQLTELVASGAIGDVRMIQAAFGFCLGPAGNTRLEPELGGGSLLDVGCYSISLSCLLIAKPALNVSARARWAPSGVDMAVSGSIHFEGDRMAQIMSAMDIAPHRQAMIIGSDGIIETDFLNQTSPTSGTLRLRRGAGGQAELETIDGPTGDGFRFEAEAFARAVQAKDGVFFERAKQLSLDTAAILDAMLISVRQGGNSVAVAR